MEKNTVTEMGIFWAFPEHFYWLAVFSAVVCLIVWATRSRRKLLKQLNLKASNLSFAAPANRKWKYLTLILGYGFLVLSYLGPQWGQDTQSLRSEGLDLCIALDLSRSMNAEDAAPSRLKLAKNQISLFLKNQSGDRVALAGFAGSGYVAAPLSVDYSSLLGFLDPMNPDFISDQSTNLAAGVDACIQALELRDEKKAEDLIGESAKVIVLVSDGEDTVEDYKNALEKVQKLKIPVYSIAMGTIKGGPIPIRKDDSTLEGYIKDPQSGQPVLSTLKDKALKEIAERTSAQVYYSSEGIGAWNRLEQALKGYERDMKEMGAMMNRVHRFIYFLIPAFLLLFFDFFLPEVKMRWKYFPFFLLLLLGAQLRAADPRSVWQNNRGLDAFSKKNFKEADTHFSESLARNSGPVAQYNWATNKLHALEELKSKGQEIKAEMTAPIVKTLQGLVGKTKGAEERKLLEHQLAQAHELTENIPEALEHYYKSLSEKAPDKALDARTRNNIVRLLKAQEQSSSSSGGGGGQGGGGGSDGKDQNKGGDEKNKDYGQNKGNQPQFSGTDVSPEQAKQILQSVSTEEKEIQKRKARQEAKERAAERRKDGAEAEGSHSKPW
jgi:Ca-activated chloride channel family protein